MKKQFNKLPKKVRALIFNLLGGTFALLYAYMTTGEITREVVVSVYGGTLTAFYTYLYLQASKLEK